VFGSYRSEFDNFYYRARNNFFERSNAKFGPCLKRVDTILPERFVRDIIRRGNRKTPTDLSGQVRFGYR